MAKKRDIIIAVVITFTFLITIGFFGIMFLGALSDEGEISLGGFGSKIAVVEVFGTIIESESVIKQLKRWGKADNIKAIVLHINSPGGGVAASQEIYNEILRIREEENKIIVASMSSVAASGGYYISCAAEKIIANPGTITGSIGVIIQYPTAEELFGKIGVKYETVKSGRLKDIGTMDRDMTEPEREMLSAMVMDCYEQFIEAIAENRDIEKENIYKLADGSVYSGRQAYNSGLIDTLGGFEDAIRLAAEMAGISGEPKTVKEIKPKKGFWEILGSSISELKNISTGDSKGPKVMYLY